MVFINWQRCRLTLKEQVSEELERTELAGSESRGWRKNRVLLPLREEDLVEEEGGGRAWEPALFMSSLGRSQLTC